jgi:chromosome condensin MukBEF MukE localization factor
MLLKVFSEKSSIKELYAEYIRLMNEVEVMDALSLDASGNDPDRTKKLTTARSLLKRIYKLKATYN